MGIDYGPGHRAVETIAVGEGQVLARLSLPSHFHGSLDQFVLHPGLLDSAFQASIGLKIPNESTSSGSKTPLKPFLPFALDELEIHGNCTPSMWALVRYSNSNKTEDKVQKLDIDLCDETGKVCVRLKGLSTRPLPGEIQNDLSMGTLMLTPVWNVVPVEKDQTLPSSTDRVLIVNGNKETRRRNGF